MKYEVKIGDQTEELDLDDDSGEVEHEGELRHYSFHQQDNGRYLLRIENKLYRLDNVSAEGSTIQFTLNGQWFTAQVRDEQDLLLDELGFEKPGEAAEGTLKAPMPGKILDIMVEEGEQVEFDQPVAILEAMKMENELKAPSAGTIHSLKVSKGDSVDKNAIILEIDTGG